MRKLVFGLFLNSYIVNLIKVKQLINSSQCKNKALESVYFTPKKGFLKCGYRDIFVMNSGGSNLKLTRCRYSIVNG